MASRKATRPKAAATVAERQAKYRRTHRDEYAQINIPVDRKVAGALPRLARHYGVTQRVMLERLLEAAEKKVLAGVKVRSAKWREYFRVT